MLFGEAHELIGNTSQRIKLKWMLAWARLEKLIEALFQINRRSAGHVIQVVTLSIPGQGRTHRGAVTCMEKIVRARKVLLFRERCRCVTKVRRVIIEKL